MDKWVTMTMNLGYQEIEVEFYDTLEKLIKDHLHGTCVMEVSCTGMVRIIKPNQLVRIFHLSPNGVFEYLEMLHKPLTANRRKQNLYMFVRLLLNRGMLFNPGCEFLKQNGGNYGYEADGTVTMKTRRRVKKNDESEDKEQQQACGNTD